MNLMFKSLSIPNKTIKWSLHSIAWIIIITIPIYISMSFGDGDTHRLYSFYLHTTSAAIIFYVGYIWLVPNFYLQKKKLMYFFLVGVLIIATFYLANFIEDNFLFNPGKDAEFKKNLEKLNGVNPNSSPPFKAIGFYIHFLSSSLISGFAMGLGVIEKLNQNEQKQKELEKEKLNSELAFLKNQISPHFFFNTLNNIYSLIGIDQHEAQASVHKLSKLMRYLLYESELGESTLADELNFTNHYIDLMKLRLSNKVNLSVSIPDDAAPLSIPPLLFVPFIENAFKHGVSYREPSFISISMRVEGTQITFQAKNSLGSANQPKDEQHSGIGLENVKKRLNLLFPDAHQLNIQQTADEFTVNLQFNANPLV